MTGDTPGVGPDDLDECWCCGGLHDAIGSLCPSCEKAGCKHFGGECQSDHKPVVPDGGRPGVGGKQWAWFDRWTQEFMASDSYPEVWDELETERHKPIIVWWEVDDAE